MTTSQTPAPTNVASACDMPDGCGAPAGTPCEIGCPSLATDEAAAEADALHSDYVHPLAPIDDDDDAEPGHSAPEDVPADELHHWATPAATTPTVDPSDLTYPRAVRRGADIVHHLIDDDGTRTATARELISVLYGLENLDRPVRLITPDGTGWLTIVRDEGRTGAVDLLARGAQF